MCRMRVPAWIEIVTTDERNGDLGTSPPLCSSQSICLTARVRYGVSGPKPRVRFGSKSERCAALDTASGAAHEADMTTLQAGANEYTF